MTIEIYKAVDKLDLRTKLIAIKYPENGIVISHYMGEEDPWHYHSYNQIFVFFGGDTSPDITSPWSRMDDMVCKELVRVVEEED